MTPPPAPLDLDHLRRWIGREESAEDILTPRLAASLRATLDCERHFPHRTAAMPVAMHWCLTPPIVPMSRLDVDGHPVRGDFLPPVPLPRRMWASSDVRFTGGPLDLGAVARHSRVADVAAKTGRRGTLVFVSVDHRYETPRGLCVEERQTIVYREAETSPAEAPARPAASEVIAGRHRLSLVAEETLLLRYSALTFNAHRIHYDRTHAVEVEGYPGLVVHGPLAASFLAEFAADLHDGKPPRRFAFRGLAPLFAGTGFTLHADPRDDGFDLAITDVDGRVTMRAEAGW